MIYDKQKEITSRQNRHDGTIQMITINSSRGHLHWFVGNHGLGENVYSTSRAAHWNNVTSRFFVGKVSKLKSEYKEIESFLIRMKVNDAYGDSVAEETEYEDIYIFDDSVADESITETEEQPKEAEQNKEVEEQKQVDSEPEPIVKAKKNNSLLKIGFLGVVVFSIVYYFTKK